MQKYIMLFAQNKSLQLSIFSLPDFVITFVNRFWFLPCI